MLTTTRRMLHSGWVFREVDATPIPHSEPGGWLAAEVPGHVHLDLMRAGVIPDPFERMHERAVQWVDERDWEYATTFDVDATALDGSRHTLRFAGLDTVATVTLNGTSLGTVDNMFVAHEFDVTPMLVAGTNRLEVRFESAQRVGDARMGDFFARHEPPGGTRFMMSRTMLRKAQYMFGWDWGPVLRGCGIWAEVSLDRVPAARLGAWSWAVSFEGDDATVAVTAEVEGRYDAVRVSLAGQVVETSPGAAAMLRVRNAERWWPAGYGPQHLYDLSVDVIVDGIAVDALQARIGLRELELVREPDEAGVSFFFRVNRVPVFAKGANWIPDDSFPARTTTARIRTLLSLARDCGMNMIRVWGGGLYESEDFYDTCDQLGLLVWQDFPYACAFYPEEDGFVTAAVEEAAAAVRRLRNHTSLALWCGNNECQWLAGMIFGPDVDVLGARLYDTELPAVVAAEDPGRPYWPGSPTGTGPDQSGDADGDSHYWNVWHGEGDWVHYTKSRARFVSEFGFSAPPDLSTLTECLADTDLGVDTPGMRWHDKTGKGYETYLGFIGLHYPAPQTLEDLVYYGQLNQADAMRFGIEHFRRLRPHTMGTLVWQLNDCWPVQSWAWVDYRLRPKAVWYAAKRFYAPLLLSLWRDGGDVVAHLVNDGGRGHSGELAVRAIDAEGTLLWSTSVAAEVDGGGSVEVLRAPLPDHVLGAPSHAVVHAAFGDVSSMLLLCEPKDLALPRPQLRVTATPIDAGTRLRLESETLALSVQLWLDGIDATWSDNYVHLEPRVPLEIDVTAEHWSTTDDPVALLRWRSL